VPLGEGEEQGEGRKDRVPEMDCSREGELAGLREGRPGEAVGVGEDVSMAEGVLEVEALGVEDWVVEVLREVRGLRVGWGVREAVGEAEGEEAEVTLPPRPVEALGSGVMDSAALAEGLRVPGATPLPAVAVAPEPLGRVEEEGDPGALGERRREGVGAVLPLASAGVSVTDAVAAAVALEVVVALTLGVAAALALPLALPAPTLGLEDRVASAEALEREEAVKEAVAETERVALKVCAPGVGVPRPGVGVAAPRGLAEEERVRAGETVPGAVMLGLLLRLEVEESVAFPGVAVAAGELEAAPVKEGASVPVAEEVGQAWEVGDGL
jgi:hypothetical protein